MTELESSKNNEIKKEIIKTLIRFDIFNHPLSSFEIHKFLGIELDYFSLLQYLADLEKEKKISSNFGFYCLPERLAIVVERFKRLNYFNLKIKKALRFTRLISFFPFIKGVFVSNIIGDHNLRKESDIDFLIISAPAKIWLTRFVCTFWAKILGLRPNSKTKENKICLSFYISSDNLNLEKYLYNEDDFYFIYWLAGLETIFFRSGVFQDFWQSNFWLKKHLPNFCFPISEDVLNMDKQKIKNVSTFNKKIEAILKKYQLKIMPQKLKSLYGVSSGVLLEDDIIKLFLEDKRVDFIDKFKERSQNL